MNVQTECMRLQITHFKISFFVLIPVSTGLCRSVIRKLDVVSNIVGSYTQHSDAISPQEVDLPFLPLVLRIQEDQDVLVLWSEPEHQSPSSSLSLTSDLLMS